MTTRLDAAKEGKLYFNSRNPCKRDGTLLRYTTNGSCVACAKKNSADKQAVFRELLKAGRDTQSEGEGR